MFTSILYRCVWIVYGSRSASCNIWTQIYEHEQFNITLSPVAIPVPIYLPRNHYECAPVPLTSTCAYIRYRRTYFYYTSSEYIVRDDNDAASTSMMVYYIAIASVCVYDYIIWWWKYFCFNKIHCGNVRMVLHFLCDARCSNTIHLYLV